jgi:hypothetical protein
MKLLNCIKEFNFPTSIPPLFRKTRLPSGLNASPVFKDTYKFKMFVLFLRL